MPRFYLVEGVKGVLCPHPSAVFNSRRHPGMKRVPLADGEKMGERGLVDLYEPTPEVFAEHRVLLKAFATGELRKLAGPVVAGDITEAAAKLRPEPAPAKPKAPRGGGND